MGKAYYRLLFYFLIGIIIPVIIFGVFSYSRSRASVKDEAVKSSQMLLGIFEERIGGIISDLDKSFICNSLVLENLDGLTPPDPEAYDFLSVKKNLNINSFIVQLSAIHNILNDISLYYKNDKIFLTPNGKFLQDDHKNGDIGVQLQNNNENLLWLGPRITNVKPGGQNIPVLLYIRQIPLVSAYKRVAFVAEIDLMKLSHYLTFESSGFADRKIYITNNKGIVLSDKDKKLIGKDLTIYPYIKNKVFSGQQGYYFIKIDNIDSLISYTYSAATGWTYITIVPLQALLEGSNAILEGIIVLTMVLVVAGLFMSFIFSSHLYNPIKKILSLWEKSPDIRTDEYSIISAHLSELSRNNMSLQQTLADNWDFIRQKTLLDILKGKIGNAVESAKIFKQYGIIEDLKNIIVIAIEIDSSEEISVLDIELYIYGVRNIIDEIITTDYNGFVVTENNTILAVATLPQADYYPDYRHAASYLCQIIKNNIEKHFMLTISIGISNLHKELSNLQKAYKEATEAVKYKMLYGKESVTFIGDAEPLNRDLSIYPYEKEKDLIKHIKTVDRINAISILEEILSYFKSNYSSYEYAKQFYIQLWGLIMMSVYEMGYSEKEIFGQLPIYINLSNKQLLDEIHEWLKDICVTIMDFIEIKRKDKNRSIVQEARNYLDEHFSDHTLSLSSVAENLYVSESYISRVFKEELGEGFVEYLTKKRLEKAKHLLRESDKNMKNIAESIGLSIQSFMRIFKQYEKTTPNQYRNNLDL